VASPQELLGECLNVPVHAPLEGPGIWRDKTYAHGRLRVDHHPAGRTRAEWRISALELSPDQPEHADQQGADKPPADLDDGAFQRSDITTIRSSKRESVQVERIRLMPPSYGIKSYVWRTQV
jgi:hypothetical protein